MWCKFLLLCLSHSPSHCCLSRKHYSTKDQTRFSDKYCLSDKGVCPNWARQGLPCPSVDHVMLELEQLTHRLQAWLPGGAEEEVSGPGLRSVSLPLWLTFQYLDVTWRHCSAHVSPHSALYLHFCKTKITSIHRSEAARVGCGADKM